jgi:hypothetical protein
MPKDNINHLPVVDAVAELQDSNTDNRQRLQKSMRAGLLNVKKSVDSLSGAFERSLIIQGEAQAVLFQSNLEFQERSLEQGKHSGHLMMSKLTAAGAGLVAFFETKLLKEFRQMSEYLRLILGEQIEQTDVGEKNDMFTTEEELERARAERRDASIKKKLEASKPPPSVKGGFFGTLGWLLGGTLAIGVAIQAFGVQFIKNLTISFRKYMFSPDSKFIAKLAKMKSDLNTRIGANWIIYADKFNKWWSGLLDTSAEKLSKFYKKLQGSSRIFRIIESFTLKPLMSIVNTVMAFFKEAGLGAKIWGWVVKVWSNSFGKLWRVLKATFKVFTPFINLMGRLGGALGKVFIPLNILISVWKAVTGFIDGWTKTEGNWLMKFIGGIGGFMKGLLGWLVGGVLDLLKDLISWIGGKLGFTNFEKWLDSWSFTDLINKTIDAVIGLNKKIFDWIWKKIDSVVDAIKNIKLSDITTMISDKIGEIWDEISNIFNNMLDDTKKWFQSEERWWKFGDGDPGNLTDRRGNIIVIPQVIQSTQQSSQSGGVNGAVVDSASVSANEGNNVVIIDNSSAPTAVDASTSTSISNVHQVTGQASRRKRAQQNRERNFQVVH